MNTQSKTTLPSQRVFYGDMPRHYFVFLLLQVAQTPQNHLTEEGDCGREPPPEYIDGARYGAADLIADMIRWRFDLGPGEECPGLTSRDVAQALKLDELIYDDDREPLVDAFLQRYESPFDAVLRSLDSLRGTVTAMDSALDNSEIPPTGADYNALYTTVADGLHGLATLVTKLKARDR